MPDAHDSTVPEVLISQLLLEDADLRDVVEEFVDELSHRVEELRQAFNQSDFDQLTTCAHRLKGAGGSYGYPDISRLAATMEQEFRQHDVSRFVEEVERLVGFARAARAGLETD